MQGDIAPFGYNLSRLLVLESIKKELGLQEVEQMFFGAAPLKNETQDFFTSLSMPIVNLYGLSETAASVTLHEFPNAKLSTCGKPLPGTLIKIFNPNEQGVGEICVKGRNVFMGYLNNDKVTWDSFDSEGFFHTGDSGYLEEADGNLVLSGRIKELIITSGGENVAPDPIEMTIKDLCPIVSNCIVVGDRQRYLTALLTLRVATSRKTGLPTNNLAPDVVLYLVSKLNSTSKTV
jgi:long-chain-fatty-acid--CoA ligase ACSBG